MGMNRGVDIALAALTEAGAVSEEEEVVETETETEPTGDEANQEKTPEDEEPAEEDEEEIPQAKINEIVQKRLARERRKFEREMDVLKGKVEVLTRQAPAPVEEDPEERGQQFMRDFATDPVGALKRFQESEAALQRGQQNEAQSTIRQAASDALENLKDKYDDFESLAPQILQELQGDPIAQRFLASLGANVTADDYQTLIERAYQNTSAKTTASVVKQGKDSVKQEVDAETAAKRKAGVSTQKATASKKAPTTDELEDAHFKMMKSTLRRL